MAGFAWLVGPMEVRETEVTFKGNTETWKSAVHIKKCRYLETSGCVVRERGGDRGLGGGWELGAAWAGWRRGVGGVWAGSPPCGGRPGGGGCPGGGG